MYAANEILKWRFTLSITKSISDTRIHDERSGGDDSATTSISDENMTFSNDFFPSLKLNFLVVCIRKPKPTDLTATSTEVVKANHEKWTKANHSCLNDDRKRFITKNIRSSILDSDNAKDYLELVEQQF